MAARYFTYSGKLVSVLDRWFYPSQADNWDTAIFREHILSFVRTESVVLDLGAGVGSLAELNLRRHCSQVCGLDISPAVLNNPHLDTAKVGSADAIPWPDKTFDVVICANVLEHLERPEIAFTEAHRVLKPGGVFLCKTPNRFHYVAIASALTPYWFHIAYNRLRGRRQSDTFPTFYRANSKYALWRLCAKAGFAASIREIEGRPEYLRISPLLYPLGIAWERIVNRFTSLSFLRVILVGTFRKAHTDIF